MSVVDKVYHKKHFYKVTWERSEQLLKEVPWLKDVKEDFCIVGYREPTVEEARDYIGDKMYDRLFDKVCGVEEISKEEALRDFEMDGWKNQKAFGFEEAHPVRASLAERLQDATARAEKQGFDGQGIDHDSLRM